MLKDVKPLLRAVADALLFLEFVPDDELAPDIAVKVMENIAFRLQEFDPADRQMLARSFEDFSGEYGDPGSTQAEFVRSIPVAVGWND